MPQIFFFVSISEKSALSMVAALQMRSRYYARRSLRFTKITGLVA